MMLISTLEVRIEIEDEDCVLSIPKGLHVPLFAGLDQGVVKRSVVLDMFMRLS